MLRNRYVAYPFEDRPIKFSTQLKANNHINYLLSLKFNMNSKYMIVHLSQHEVYDISKI